MENIILKFALGALITTTVATSGAAIVKMSAEKQTTETESRLSIGDKDSGKIALAAGLNQKSKTSNTQPQNTSLAVANTNTLTLAELSTHNTSNSCYIAHNGSVYDVTNISVWAGCRHHGASGGIDITAFFPHPISYLGSANMVGALASNQTGTVSNSTNKSSGQIIQSGQNYIGPDKDKDNNEDRYEYEDYEDND